jgi:predicted phosphodiesterase
MYYAIVSDVHGRRHKLAAVLLDAHKRGADQVISLGDVGGDHCLSLLRAVGARAVFGNYEVSGWGRLHPEHRSWVQEWQPMLAEDSYLAVHAVPWWPEGLRTVEDFEQWLDRTGLGWRALFPYLSESEEALWRAMAELEAADKAILFHGHTHRQSIWRWQPSGRLRRLKATTVPLEAGSRYCVGVGSVGLPEDGAWAAYTLYDPGAARLEQVRLPRLS